MAHSEEERQHILKKLRILTPIFAKASIGDFSQDVEIPEDEDEFSELYAGIQIMLDVIRQKIINIEKEAEERRRTELRLRSVLDVMVEGFQIIGFDWRYLYVNDSVSVQGRRLKQDLLGHTMMEMYPGIQDTELFKHLKRCMEERTADKIENEFIFPDGVKGLFELRIEPIPEGIFILSLDVTERKLRQEELLELASIIEFSNDAIVGKDLEGKILNWNPSAERLYGYAKDEIIGKSIEVLFPQEKKDEFQNNMERIKKSERLENFETERVRKDGKRINVSVTISPIKNKDGVVMGASDIARDITVQKKLQGEQSRLASIVESSNDAIIGKNLDGGITTWNTGAERLYGYKAEEIIGKSYSILVPEEKLDEWNKIIQRVKKGEIIKNYETVRVRKDGQKIDVDITYSPVKDPAGNTTGISAIARDISERKKVDLMKNEFVALASHQLKTPLTSIKWYAELLLKNTGPDFTLKQIEYLHQIHRANKRMIYLINSLLNVSRIDLGTFIIKPQKLDLIEVIESLLMEFQVQITEKHIQIHKEFEKDLPSFSFDPNVMRIIVSNLVLNAIRYSPVGGAVEISVRRKERQILIEIADHGIGIPQSQIDKIFKKFSRADNAMKQNTDGSGLGLYIVKSLVDRSGGEISFTSKEKEGTVFTVSYPDTGMKEKDGK